MPIKPIGLARLSDQAGITRAAEGEIVNDLVSRQVVRVVSAESAPVFVTLSGAGTISIANTSTALLGIGAIFTGAFEDVSGVATISVFVRADQVSATNGLKIEWSTDGVTVHDDDLFNIVANAGRFFTFGPQTRFVRVRYVNGAIVQGSFVLQTIYHSIPIKPSSHRMDDAITGENVAELVKAGITGKNPLGAFTNARVTEAGGLLVSSAELTTPPDTVAVRRIVFSAVAVSSDDIYTITNTKTLVIQRMSAAIESSTAGSAVVLYEDPNGDLSVLNPIEVQIQAGSSGQAALNSEYVGNGTRRIVMRRERYDGGSRRIFGRWEGYERS